MSELIPQTKQKWKSFAEIAPMWAEYVRTRFHKEIAEGQAVPVGRIGFYRHGVRHSIMDNSCCMVGEAWGGDEYIKVEDEERVCDTCDTMSWDVVQPARWLEAIPKFVRHFNEVHGGT